MTFFQNEQSVALNQKLINVIDLKVGAHNKFLKTQSIENFSVIKISTITSDSFVEVLGLKEGEIICAIDFPKINYSKKFNYRTQLLEQWIKMQIYVFRENPDLAEQKLNVLCLNESCSTFFVLPLFFLEKDSINLLRFWDKIDISKTKNSALRKRNLAEGLLFVRCFFIETSLLWIKNFCIVLKTFWFFLINLCRLKFSFKFHNRLKKNSFKNEHFCLEYVRSEPLILAAFANLVVLHTLVALFPFRGSDGFMFLKILYTDILIDLKKKNEFKP